MNERDENGEAPFPREPWQRLLEESSDGPSQTTDARIRAKARRDLAPRGHRWWLPAALAASFVLAVVIVRSEFGNEGEQAREPGHSPTAAAASKEKPRAEAESDVYGYADSELGQEDAGTGPLVGGPERERRAASEAPEERMEADSPTTRAESSFAAEPPPAVAPPVAMQRAAAPAAKEGKKLDQVIVTGSSAREAKAPASWTPTHVAAPVDNVQPRSAGGGAGNPAPEAWYAAVEKLRADGRTQEADRELEKLKKAYPGWLEPHLKELKKP